MRYRVKGMGFREGVAMTDFPGGCQQPRAFGHGRLGLLAVLLMFVSVAIAQIPDGYIIPNFKDVELSQLAVAVSKATGKNFIIDPRVHARATMISRTPLSPAAFYEAFLSILQVEGFVAVPSGDVVTILPRVNARPRGQSNGAPVVITAALGTQTLTIP
jgi:general secretion pathway protein D